MKTQLILTLYDMLCSDKGVDRKVFCKDFEISERTFYRYIKEINLFIMHTKRNFVLREEEPAGLYYIEKINNWQNLSVVFKTWIF